MILGGAGLVGLQVCRHIVHQLQPKRIVVASLFLEEAQKACHQLEKEFGDKIAFVPESGNLFVPTDLSSTSRGDLLSSSTTRRRLLGSLYDQFETAYQENHLVHLIKDIDLK